MKAVSVEACAQVFGEDDMTEGHGRWAKGLFIDTDQTNCLIIKLALLLAA